jgi:hypothetical protein
MYQIVNGQPKSMLEINKTLKPPIVDIVTKALSKDPAERYTTCSEFAHALLTGTAPAPVVQPAAAKPAAFAATQVVGGGAAAVAAPAPVAKSVPAPAPAPAKATGSRAFLYVSVFLVLLAAGAFAWIQLSAPQPAPQTTPVVESNPPAAVKPAARKPEGRKPARRTKPVAAEQTQAGAPAAAEPEPEVELIDDKQPEAPKVPRVFDKAK